MSQKEGLLSPFLYEDSEESGSKGNSFKQLKRLETMITCKLAIMEQYSFESAVREINGFYDLLEDQICGSVSGKGLDLILNLHFEMHNTLTRVIKKKTIKDSREVTRSSGALPNREDARVPAQAQHPFISETSGESSDESKFGGFDALSPTMKEAAKLDLNILKQIIFVITYILGGLKTNANPNVIRYYNSKAKVAKELIAKFSILGLDTSPFQGTTFLVPTRLRF